MARSKAVLGDLRRDDRASLMLEQIVSTGSVVLREFGGSRPGEMAAHRLLSSKKVDPVSLLAPHVARTAMACKGRRVVAAQDTSEISFARRRKPVKGMGPTGNTGITGFFVHPVVAIDAEDEALLGIAGAQIWTRGQAPTPDHKGIPYLDKESKRWLEGAQAAALHLAQEALQVVMVADQESDIYPMFARRPATIDFVVRANHNRVLAGGGKLHEAPATWPELGTAKVKVSPKGIGDKGRTATVVMRAGTVTIARPDPRNAPDRQDPRTLTLGLVEVREDPADGAKAPLLWRLVTTLPVADLDDALEVVRLYRLRWRIEEVFRGLKSDGLDIENSQLETAGRMLNLAALALVAAARIIQLVDARSGSNRPATDVIAAQDIPAAAAKSAKLEGNTPARKTPMMKAHSPGCHGSRPASADGTATINPQDPKPWHEASTGSSTASRASISLGSKMCESRRDQVRGDDSLMLALRDCAPGSRTNTDHTQKLPN